MVSLIDRYRRSPQAISQSALRLTAYRLNVHGTKTTNMLLSGLIYLDR